MFLIWLCNSFQKYPFPFAEKSNWFVDLFFEICLDSKVPNIKKMSTIIRIGMHPDWAQCTLGPHVHKMHDHCVISTQCIYLGWKGDIAPKIYN